jgi:hypothetical protein
MAQPLQLSPADRRRRRLVVVAAAAGLLLAATGLFRLESGTALVVYNDTGESLSGVAVAVGPVSWDCGALDPRESRRWHPPEQAAGEVRVVVEGWAAAVPTGTFVAPGSGAQLALRLGPLQTVSASETLPWWRRWIR